jgi:integrase/recombinase XerC
VQYRITKDKFLSREERQDLIVKVAVWQQTSPRNAALILVAMYTGGRAQEILNIRWQDISELAQTIYVRGMKDSDDREMKVPAWIIQAVLKTKSPDSLPGDKVFKFSYERFVQIWKMLEMRKPIKAMRHTFAMQLYESTTDIFFVKKALGHRSLSSTMVYVEYIMRTQSLEKITQISLYGMPCE